MTAPTLVDFAEVVERYDPVIGLEVHVELSHEHQDVLRLPHRVRRRAEHPGLPGLPGPARLAAGGQRAPRVESAIRIGLALNCTIAPWCRFARKNYFYPDMPKNFQTSQYDEPIAVDGYLDVDAGRRRAPSAWRSSGRTWRRTPASRCTSAAPPAASTAPTHSLLDYNRAGIPLIEIVTKPIPGTGARAPEVAKAYVTALRELLRALGVSDVRMEQGSLRCDVNLSLSPRGAGELGHPHRDEERQLAALGGAGGPLRDAPAGRRARRRAARSSRRPGTSTRTPAPPRSGRSKETAEDYRYFPEPDLVPVAPPAEWVEELRADAAGAAAGAPAPGSRRSGALSDPEHAASGQRRRAWT